MNFEDLHDSLQREARQRALAEGIPAADLPTVMKGGKRKIVVRRVVAASLAIFMVMGAVAAATLIDFSDRKTKKITPADIVPTASRTERAGVFAIRAVAAAGMSEQEVPGSYADYEGISETAGGWEATFTIVGCEPMQEDVVCTLPSEQSADNSLSLSVEERDGKLQVGELAGPVSEEERATLLAYREDAGPELPALQALPFSIRGSGENRALRGRAVWTGPIPFDGLANCKRQLLDDSGNVVHEEIDKRLVPASGREDEGDEERGEAGRDDHLIWPPLSIPPGTENPQGRYLCETFAFSPKKEISDARVDSPTGYKLKDFGVQHLFPVENPESPELARVHYRAYWLGDRYPGVRRCTFTVTGSDGEEIGAITGLVDDIEPGQMYNLEDVEIDAIPRSVDVSCDPDRVDDAEGRFIFTDIELVRTESDSLEVRATRRWDGGEMPALQNCVVRLFGPGGAVVAEEGHTLSAPSTERKNEVVRSFRRDDNPALDAAETAEIDCVPFT